jgi:hypothetical protein
MYYFITLKGGKKMKTLSEKTTEKEIREYFKEDLEDLYFGVIAETQKDDFKRYFKIHLGYNDEMKLSIGEEEIAKVMTAFLTGKKIQTSAGAIDGSKIILIKEDWNKTMNWNETHQLTSDDWNELKNNGVEDLYKGYLEDLKLSVKNILSSGQLKLN